MEYDPKNEAITEVERKTGPSNFLRAMSHRPEATKEFAALYDTLMGPGAVDERLKELVYVAVSSVNECKYCGSHHDVSARRAGVTDHELDDIKAETDQTFDERERAALRYARELTRTADAEHETKDMIENLFTAEQRVELTMVVALANFTNRFNNGLRIPVEKQRHWTAQ
ncbi:MAG TPA: carboxymuconolactone decarboxylase family protein [Bryobacteraceae bacterium]|nr:carboxymuconolactone decarboxylase family protein [Bryobacteraceae bacterium]